MLISNARVVTRDDVFIGTVQIDGESIRAVSRGTTAARDADDWGGDYLLPGLVELHTDNLEKHLAPRPGVYWNVDAAFVTHDAQVAAAGITTVFDALAIGTRLNVGVRGRDVQTQCADALARFASHGLLRAEHFLHLRCEIATEDVVDVFDSLARHPRLRLASVMDHTPGQRQWKDPQQWRHYQERHRKWSDEEAATTIAELADEQQRYADAHRRAIVARCRALGVPVASHDDTVIEHVEQAAREGIALAEFPTTHAAAEAARARHRDGDGRAEPRARRLAFGQCVGARARAGGAPRHPVVRLRAVEPAMRGVRPRAPGALEPAARDRHGVGLAGAPYGASRSRRNRAGAACGFRACRAARHAARAARDICSRASRRVALRIDSRALERAGPSGRPVLLATRGRSRGSPVRGAALTAFAPKNI